MPRPRDDERRRRLRQSACDYLLRVGVSAADLGQIAAELGTSSRMLIHYFGSKDGLIAAGVEEARDRQRALFADWLEHRGAQTFPGLLQVLWDLMLAPEAQPYLRLFSEVYVLSIQEPERFPGFSAAKAVHDWLPGLEDRLRAGGTGAEDARALATMTLAVQRGLLLDRQGTGDEQRVRAAHEALVSLLSKAQPAETGRD